MEKRKQESLKRHAEADKLKVKHGVSASVSNELLCETKRHDFKDHEIAILVNELRNIAVTLHNTQMLRDRISRCIVSFLNT